jgi:hypothetical protein
MRLIFSLLLSGLCSIAFSQSLEDSNRFFEFAEDNYPQFFSPAEPENVNFQGYLVRYYADTNIYLATRDGGVFVYRPDQGSGIISLGGIFNFILEESGSEEPAAGDEGPIDLTELILSNRSANCADYAGDYISSATDVSRSLSFDGDLSISVENGECTFISNNIPNHDMGQGGNFATAVAEVATVYTITASPQFASAPTALTLDYDNAVLLNGVKVDLFAAACFGVADEKIGCNDINQPWRFDPMSPLNTFGTDIHNAHTQPDGGYHYHGNPMTLFDFDNAVESPVIGFAADGFPIFGTYFDDSGIVRKAETSYQFKQGSRPEGVDDPGGEYDGTYRDDYEYIEGLGDLDECNGMSVDGDYGYYIIDDFPYLLGCYSGVPNDTFRKGGAGGPP